MLRGMVRVEQIWRFTLVALTPGAVGVIAISVVLAQEPGAPAPSQGAPGPRPFGMRGGPMMEEQKVVEQFDKNKDKRLDALERKAARAWLATNCPGRRGFGG